MFSNIFQTLRCYLDLSRRNLIQSFCGVETWFGQTWCCISQKNGRTWYHAWPKWLCGIFVQEWRVLKRRGKTHRFLFPTRNSNGAGHHTLTARPKRWKSSRCTGAVSTFASRCSRTNRTWRHMEGATVGRNMWELPEFRIWLRIWARRGCFQLLIVPFVPPSKICVGTGNHPNHIQLVVISHRLTVYEAKR